MPKPVNHGTEEVPATVLAPLFMPTAAVVPAIGRSGATSVRQLIEDAEIKVNDLNP